MLTIRGARLWLCLNVRLRRYSSRLMWGCKVIYYIDFRLKKRVDSKTWQRRLDIWLDLIAKGTIHDD